MILVDSSVWIEYLRGTATVATSFVRERVGIDLAATEPVMMEVLAGARPGRHAAGIEQLLLSQSWCSVEPRLDFRGAVDVFHATRRSGHQPRSLNDCLIAAVALRGGWSVAHRDADFERIASATGLPVVDLRRGSA